MIHTCEYADDGDGHDHAHLCLRCLQNAVINVLKLLSVWKAYLDGRCGHVTRQFRARAHARQRDQFHLQNVLHALHEL